MGNRKHKGYKGADKREHGRFLAVPMDVLMSPTYIALSPKAKALLFDLGAQYNGSNNGDLTCAWKIMKRRGWRSEQTLANAKREILDAAFIAETRKGARPNKAGLYAITWFDLDDCGGKLDIAPRAYVKGAWRIRLGIARTPNSGLATEIAVGGAG